MTPLAAFPRGLALGYVLVGPVVRPSLRTARGEALSGELDLTDGTADDFLALRPTGMLWQLSP